MKTAFHYQRILRLETSQQLGTVKFELTIDDLSHLKAVIGRVDQGRCKASDHFGGGVLSSLGGDYLWPRPTLRERILYF
jgi:hypothetical protein